MFGLPPRYLISRNLDPIFALGLGLASAAVRIRREESEKVFGRYTFDRVPWSVVTEKGSRRWNAWWKEQDIKEWAKNLKLF